jgi:transcriptional regulator with XRE-family HTH domain
MNGEGGTGIEDIVRRNIAALRAKASLTQQALADEMLLRGVAWTRETVAQVETTNRRIGLAEAIAVAACLDVPLARLTATGADTVSVGESRWTAPYLAAAIAGTAGDVFHPESYAAPGRLRVEQPRDTWDDEELPARRPVAPGDTPMELERRRRPRDRRPVDMAEPGAVERPTAPESDGPHKTAERIERRLRLRVTAGDVDTTAQHLWSRSLDAERERRVAERQTLTGGSLPTIRGHVSRDLDRELAHEMEKQVEGTVAPDAPSDALTADEAAWEATRLNIILANKGYSDSDVTRWWNFTRHRELADQTIAEAWRDGHFSAVSRLIQALADKRPPDGGAGV